MCTNNRYTYVITITITLYDIEIHVVEKEYTALHIKLDQRSSLSFRPKRKLCKWLLAELSVCPSLSLSLSRLDQPLAGQGELEGLAAADPQGAVIVVASSCCCRVALGASLFDRAET